MKTALLALLLAGVIATGACADGLSYTATGDDQSALEVTGSETLHVAGATIKKTDGKASSADASSFRGVNAAVRVADGALLDLTDSVIEATAPNATGVFAYNGGTVDMADCVVTVTGGGAGGVQVAGGGTLTGKNLTVTSAGKAAIRSDRGGGVMVLEGGTYVSTGTNGCPAIYSTADITVRDAACVSEKSRAVIIEGKNSVTLENVVISGNDRSTKSGSVHANVLLYQSASGDAKEGVSEFTMKGGEITGENGAMFYCTNTESVIRLESADLRLSEDGSLLIVSAGRWGREGKNGGRCALYASDQALYGSVTVDQISTLSVTLTQSTFAGTINSTGAAGSVSVALDGESAWQLTADSYITAFEGDLSQVDANGHHLYVSGEMVL